MASPKFLDFRGHLINPDGLEIDDTFRSLDASGAPAFETLFAAGSILAHNDWKRMNCGAVLAIATAPERLPLLSGCAGDFNF